MKSNNLTKAVLARELCSRRTVTFNLQVQERTSGNQGALFATAPVNPPTDRCEHATTQEQRTFAGSIENVCTRCGAVVGTDGAE